MNNFGITSGNKYAGIAKRIQGIEKRISKEKIPQNYIDTTFKKCKMQNAANPKHSGNSGHNEKTKQKNIRYRSVQRFPN